LIDVAERETAGSTLTTSEMLRFFSVLSHDLKSPIFSVDGFSELLLADYESKLDADGVDFLRRIRSSVQQMKRVLDDVGHMVKLLSRDANRREVNIAEVLDEVRLKFNYLLEDGGVKLETDTNAAPVVSADPEMLKEILSVLISNALAFTDEQKEERTVRIQSDLVGTETRICVKDNGIGIDSRYAGQVFDLGVKLDKSRGGGPGYGLYLARRLAEIHGGAITLESQPDQGSTFCVTFPSA
jgi:signal transduction histidine kinase